jgi:hypothetical protein
MAVAAANKKNYADAIRIVNAGIAVLPADAELQALKRKCEAAAKSAGKHR